MVLSLLLATATSAQAEQKTHVVARGHTLSAIAQRYGVTVDAICQANGLENEDKIVAGQELIIPNKSGSKDSASSSKIAADGMQTLAVAGHGTAYYYAPTGPGRLALRPVIMYLHGRGGRPASDCRRWSKVARRVGWLVCPSGPGARGEGRGWNNSWSAAHAAATATVKALRAKYGRRVQLYGNTLVGFSEGAFVAMNVGVREPRTFNRWLILGANDSYWGAPGRQALARAKSRLRRVYLITGEKDGVIEGTRSVRKLLRKYGIPTRITTPDSIGHQVALGKKPELYRMALIWLQSGRSSL